MKCFVRLIVPANGMITTRIDWIMIASSLEWDSVGSILPATVALFGEVVSFSDFVSTLLLLNCSGVSLLIFVRRLKQRANGAPIWAMMSAGLCFLAQDEFFSLHEGFDAWFHEMSGLQPTEWTSQIDTLVLASYAGIALCLLWLYRSEFVRSAPAWKYFLIAGLAVAFLSIGLDGLGNCRRAFSAVFGDRADDAYIAIANIENACELSAELLFLTFFMHAYWYSSATSLQEMLHPKDLAELPSTATQ